MRRRTDTNANAGQQADNSYYNQTLSNPVVNPVDKYSYSQMVNDISALVSRYPGTVTVKSIGKSADGRDIYDVIVAIQTHPRRFCSRVRFMPESISLYR